MDQRMIMMRILELDAEFRQLTGRAAFGYVSAPTATTKRYVFQDGTVKLSAPQALDHMVHLALLARTNPAGLPYPFDQELTAAQDQRGDAAWINERLAGFLAGFED